MLRIVVAPVKFQSTACRAAMMFLSDGLFLNSNQRAFQRLK